MSIRPAISRPPSSMFATARTIAHTWLRMDFFGGATATDAGGALTSTIFSQSFFALVLAALLFEPNANIVAYAAANLSLSTLLVGIGALADPQRALRRRSADATLLLTAPIRRGTLPLARAMHGAFYIALIATGMAIPPAILCYWVAGHSLVAVPLYLIGAVALAGSMAGGLALLLNTAERMFGRGPALLAAGTLRGLLLGGGFIAFALCLQHLDASADALPLGRAGAWAWPPYWTARWIASPSTEILALGATLGLGGALFVWNALSTEVPQPRTHRRRGRGRRGPLLAFERACARGGPLLGATRFVAIMLFRNASFRARVLPLLGMPVAMTILAFLGEDPRGGRLLLGMTMQFPTIYLPFLIAFLPNAERPGSGHVFAASPRGDRIAMAREAALLALTSRVLTPALLVGAILAALGGQPLPVVLGLTAFSWGLAVWIACVQLKALERMPFSGDDPDATDAEPGNLIAFGVLVAVAGGAYALFVDHPLVIVLGCVVAVSAARRLTQAPRHALIV